MSAEPVPFGRYVLLERIAVGGVGEVFLARRSDGGGLVVVERPLPGIDDDPRRRAALVETTSRVASLSHPNLVEVLDLGQLGGRTFVVSEHVAGLDLGTVLARARERGAGKLPLPLACLVASELARGLDALHGAGIVHGDVSPGHVLLSFTGMVKLLDAGLLPALGTDETTRGALLRGRYGYQSPEQLRDLPAEPASDVFALGALLTELLCGRPLFVGRGDFHVMELVRNLEVTPPRALDRSIPVALEAALLRALARDPRDRFPSAGAFRQALLPFTRGPGGEAHADDLAAWLSEAFADERTRASTRWALLRNRPVAAASAPLLDWDDDEAATRIYDRDGEAEEPAGVAGAPGPAPAPPSTRPPAPPSFRPRPAPPPTAAPAPAPPAGSSTVPYAPSMPPPEPLRPAPAPAARPAAAPAPAAGPPPTSAPSARPSPVPGSSPPSPSRPPRRTGALAGSAGAHAADAPEPRGGGAWAVTAGGLAAVGFVAGAAALLLGRCG